MCCNPLSYPVYGKHRGTAASCQYAELMTHPGVHFMHTKDKMSPILHVLFTISLHCQYLPSYSFLIPANNGTVHVFCPETDNRMPHGKLEGIQEKYTSCRTCVDSKLAVPGGYKTDGLPVIVSSSIDERTSN